MGTFGYMAPEQARGSRDIGVGADVFALGCVLYECLAGAAAFGGQNDMAIRAKILLTEPEPLHLRRPDLPESLRRLVEGMLAKEPAARPADAAAVADALAALDPLPEGPRRSVGQSQPPTVTHLPGTDDPAELDEDVVCLVLAALESGEQADEPEQSLPDNAELAPALKLELDQIERIGDDSLVIQIAGTGSSGDRAERAARVALALRDLVPEARIAVAGAPEDKLYPRGPSAAIESGTAILEAAAQQAIFADVVDSLGDIFGDLSRAHTDDRPGAQASSAPIALDSLCANLLSPRFQIQKTERGWSLGADLSVA